VGLINPTLLLWTEGYEECESDLGRCLGKECVEIGNQEGHWLYTFLFRHKASHNTQTVEMYKI